MQIDSNELIRLLPAMLQGRRKFAPMSEGGDYHVGKVDEWCLFFPDVVQAIEDFCEYKETGKCRLSAPIDGNWNVLNAYPYEPPKSEENDDVDTMLEHLWNDVADEESEGKG